MPKKGVTPPALKKFQFTKSTAKKATAKKSTARKSSAKKGK